MMKLLLIKFLILISVNSFANLNDVQNSIEDNHIVDTVDKNLSQGIKQSLKKDTRDKKIIFLGEADHFFHEKYIYRLVFIKELLKNGYYNIYAELGVTDGMMVNRYLETGDESFLKKVGLYGFKYGSPLRFKNNAFVSEQVRYFKELRALKLKYPKLKYAGFDLDMVPGNFYLEYDEMKSRVDVTRFIEKNTEFAKLMRFIELSKNSENKQLYINLSYKIAQELKEVGIKNVKNYKEFLHLIKVFKDSLYFRVESRKKPFRWSIYHWREKRMFEIMEYEFQKKNSAEKYIFLGHNGHLTKTDAKNRNGDRYTTWDTIGAWITKSAPSDVFAIWSFIGRGEHSGHGCQNGGSCEIKLIKGTLEERLYKISPIDGIYFKNNPVIKRNENIIKTVVNGYEVTSGKYGDSADAFYFIPEVNDLTY